MRYLLRHIVICFALLLIACQKEGVEEYGDSVSLTFRLATSAMTRGNVTEFPSDPSTWSQAEQVVDGRYLYTVSVYLVDEARQIVARQENIAVADQAKEVVVKFDESYQLKRGLYTLMAVANQTDCTINGTTYDSGLLSGWVSSTYEELMSNKIGANEDNISPKDVVQPLSLMKEIELHAGRNVIEGELVRTFARIRIEINNNSGTLPLSVNKLTFSDNFAQRNAYVFDDGTTRKYFGTSGAPVATSDSALQSLVNENGNKTIQAQTSAVVFDGYLLESAVDDDASFTYTLDLTYDGVVSETHSFSRTSNTYINRVSDLDVGAESYFLIYNTERKRYLSAGEDDQVMTASINDFSSLSPLNVWQLIKSGNNYYIKNVNTGLYMQTPTGSAVSLGSTPVAYSIHNYDSYSYLSLECGNYYIEVRNSSNNYAVRGNTNHGNSRRFYLYPVTKRSETSAPYQINYNTPITLTSIDPESQQSKKVTAIKRNDFINVLVTVSYNPESGKFEFHVEDWETGGGNVEFN